MRTPLFKSEDQINNMKESYELLIDGQLSVFRRPTSIQAVLEAILLREIQKEAT